MDTNILIQILEKYLHALQSGDDIGVENLQNYNQSINQLQKIPYYTHIWNLLVVIVPELKLFHGGLDMNIIWWISPVNHLKKAISLLQDASTRKSK